MNNVKVASKLKLDPAKLLGFRNLPSVMKRESDLRESSDLVLVKRGNETFA